MILRDWKKKLIICNQLQELNSITALMVPQRKLHILKILQKIRKRLWIEYFDEVKRNATYSDPIAKHAPSKVWHFFLLFTLLKRKIHHHFVGQSRKSWSAHCLAFLIFVSGWLKKFKMYSWRINEREIKILNRSISVLSGQDF